MDHAVLAPSSSGRWLICTPSARLELLCEDVESDYAREGTLAHSIAEDILRVFLTTGTLLLTLEQWQAYKVKEFYTEAMYEHCQDYGAYVTSFYKPGDLLLIEADLQLKKFIPEGFGHSDSSVLQVAKKHLHIFDYKYGKGVLVSAQDNSQLKIYAIGVLEQLLYLYDIETVTVHIYQPRMQNIDMFTISVKDLYAWAKNILKPKADLAFAGEGELVAGNHCYFCKAAAQCRALADYNNELAKHDFDEPYFLKDHEIIEIYERKKLFESWMKAVDTFMLNEALKGKVWQGYKLVHGISKRSYKDQDIVAKKLLSVLKNVQSSEIYKPKELLGITELAERIGQQNFDKYVAPLLKKPVGAPTLAVLTDTRTPYSPALLDFSEPWVDPNEDYSDL